MLSGGCLYASRTRRCSWRRGARHFRWNPPALFRSHCAAVTTPFLLRGAVVVGAGQAFFDQVLSSTLNAKQAASHPPARVRVHAHACVVLEGFDSAHIHSMPTQRKQTGANRYSQWILHWTPSTILHATQAQRRLVVYLSSCSTSGIAALCIQS